MVEYEDSGWEFGPGNQDDGMPDAGQYGPPEIGDQDSFYSQGGLYDFGSSPAGGDFGPGNTEQWNNIGGTPVFGNGQFGGGFMQGNQFQNYADLQGYQSPTQQNLSSAMGGTQNFLSQLFGGGQGSKGALTGLGALIEGMQNKKKASSVQNIVNQQQARMDPFGSQRPQYQQELSRTMQDPYSAPIVRNQVQQMQQAQAIKDAAAGRRSNQATSNPALLAAQAQVAQKYMDSLYTPAGANISPNASGLNELMQGNNAAINGYASPIMSALGYNSSSGTNTQAMQQIMDALAKFKAGG